MASPPPPPGSFSSQLFAQAEALSENTGVIVMLIVSLELVLFLLTSFTDFHKIGSEFTIGSILTAILPLQTALVGYANSYAANQRQALMAISAVSILCLSHQSNWFVNVFSWKSFANVMASSASILVSASAVLFTTGFNGHYRRVPVYAFVIVISVVEGMSAFWVAVDILTAGRSERLNPLDSNVDGVAETVKNLIEHLQQIVLSGGAPKEGATPTKASKDLSDNLACLLMRNRDFFRVLDPVRGMTPIVAILSGFVLLSLMAVAAADTHGFERIVLSFCTVAVFLRVCVVFYLWLPADKALPEVCQGLYGIEFVDSDRSPLHYFRICLSASAGRATDKLPVLLRAWYDAHRNNKSDIVREALALAPDIIKMELATWIPSKSLLGLAKEAVAKGFGPDRKLRWSKFELNLFLVWYASLFELVTVGDEGKPFGNASKGEEAV
ncbi:hypothetical protein KFL_002490080 [Klebsormidium nitens]|uniref:Transmembrane protein n=1 Tax=Klebsormidium nitens TaxID=105231 RepID=A0A1Y1I431_KLENI|nr:hypothetical protein KFL_002490080 [Klebsormidium nitens]|eukprot:GAQ85690.1 hypothetical protein KFL_002490080 [Klebsormidium nitens]